jgi:xanthine dehydrogenase accessory factor
VLGNLRAGVAKPEGIHPAAQDALRAILYATDPAVLAVITGVEGPAYRRPGTLMALFPSGRRAGALSSGCIEGDLVFHAEAALNDGRPRTIRYGAGSPYIDIQLPCGGGLDVTLVPNPDLSILAEVEDRRSRREAFSLMLAPERLELAPLGPTGWTKDGFRIALIPEVRFLIFGKGLEGAFFADLVRSLGYPHLLLSPEEETLGLASASGCATASLTKAALPVDLDIDAHTAVVLFFHDHSWEPPILTHALASPAFYIGAQGSRKARDGRLEAMRCLGVRDEDLERLRGPIGLIPSVRDPRSLAVSVLAEVLTVAEAA